MKAKNTSNAKNVADNDLLNPFRADETLRIDTATSNPIQEVNYFPFYRFYTQIPRESSVWITNELTYVKCTSCKRRTFGFFYFLLIYVKWQLTQKFCTNHLFATNHRKKWRERCLVANTYFYRVSIFVFFSNNNVIFVNCIFVGIILDSYFSEARQRANEIVKSSRPVSSPERSLLAETPLHHGDQDQGSIYTETIDLSSPTNSNFRIAEPPRNIFDDIWKISMHFNTILLAINKDLTIIEQNFCTFFGINLFRLWKNTQS